MHDSDLGNQEQIQDHKGFSASKFFCLCPDMLCVINHDGYFIEASPAWERVLGWTSSELRSRPWLEFVHPDDKLTTAIVLKLAERSRSAKVSSNSDRHNGHSNQTLEAQKFNPYTFQIRFLNKDNTYTWLSWSISPYLEEHLYATVRDISEHAALRDNSSANLPLQYPQELAKLIITASFDGIIAFDRECRYTLWNQGMERMIGLKANEVLGKRAFDVLPFLQQIREDKYYFTALSGENIIAKERPFLSPKGKAGFYEAYYGPLTDYLGKVVGGIAIIRDITERVETEQRLRRNAAELGEWKNRYEAAGLASGQILYEWNSETNTLLWGGDLGNILGYSLPEVADTLDRFVDLIHPEDRETYELELQRTLHEKDSFYAQYRLQCQNGSYIHIEDRSRFFLDRLGSSHRTIGFISDISDRLAAFQERELAQAKLQESYSLLEAVIEGSPDNIYVKDLQGRYRLLNSAALKTLGKEASQVIGKTDTDIFPGIYGLQLMQRELTILTTAEEQIAEESVEINGALRTFLSSKGVYRNYQGEVLGLIGVSRDITERKLTEQALQESEEFLRLALDSGQTGTWELDLVNYKFKYSEQLSTILGLPQNYYHLTYEEFLNIIHPEDRNRVEQAIAQAIREQQPYHPEFRIVLPNSTIRWLGTRGKVYYDDNHNPIRIAGVTTDITDRKLVEEVLQRSREQLEILVQERTAELMQANLELEMEITERKQAEQRLAQVAQELKRSNLELEQFAYVASHDLQEPLRAVTSFTQLLQQYYGHEYDERAAKYMGYIVDGALRMQQLINDLLTFSRAGRGALKLEPTDFNSLMESILKNLHLAIAESQAQIIYSNLPTVVVDAVQFGQLLQNLIGNAIKFRRQTPVIEIAAVLESEQWHFTVSDNGIGIEANYFERIFTIFQRLHNRREYPGTGIGLSLCRKIVERHNGKIWVESEFGQGTIFHFTIPLTIKE